MSKKGHTSSKNGNTFLFSKNGEITVHPVTRYNKAYESHVLVIFVGLCEIQEYNHYDFLHAIPIYRNA